MACGILTKEVEQQVTAYSATARYVWFTDWMTATGLDDIKAVLKNKAVSGNFQSQLAVQYAAVRTNSPHAPALLDSPRSGAGEWCTGAINISADTSSKLFVRFGVAASLSSGTTPAEGTVTLQVSGSICGKFVGSKAAEQLIAPDTANYYLPLSGWLPAAHVTKVKAGILVTNADIAFQCRMAYQTATTSIESPNAWSTTLDSWRTGDIEVNTSELNPSSANDMWIRFGLQYSCVTANTNKKGFVSVAVAIRD